MSQMTAMDTCDETAAKKGNAQGRQWGTVYRRGTAL
jgi:hypothetical protein